MIVRRLVPTLGVVAVLAAGCGGWRDEQAAKVDTASVTMSSLRDEVTELVDHPDLATIFKVEGSGVGAAESTATLVSWLDQRIVDLSIDEELGRRGVSVDAAGLTRAEADLRLQFQIYQQQVAGSATTPATPQSAEEQFDALSSGFRGELIEREAARDALAVDLSEASGTSLPLTAQDWYDTHPDDFLQVCVSLILSRDEASSRAAKARVDAGTPFATVATEVSADTTTATDGGTAGCAFTRQLSETLADELIAAGQGNTAGPTRLSDAWYLFQVTRLGTASFTDAQAAVASSRLSARQEALSAWLTTATPEVEVSPRLGRWDAENRKVVANPGPAPAPTAVQP